MSREDHLKFGIALNLIEGVGNVIAKTLIGYCGSPEEVFKSPIRHLEKIPNIGIELARRIKNFQDYKTADTEVEWILKNNVNAHFYFDKSYPYRLKMCSDAPVIIYTNSKVDLNCKKVLSIVGTRKATHYGKSFTRELVSELSRYDCIVVSGMAYGIDIEAHKACLNFNVPTIGVVAHGLGQMYPAVHRKYANKMKESGGALLSEFLHDAIANKENFPLRNRIITGLADAVIVVERGVSGGSIITANLANGYNREVFALPGSVYSEKSKGCNQLIKENKAYLIESINDLEYHLGWATRKSTDPQKEKLTAALSQNEKKVLKLLEEGEMGIDELYHLSEIAMSDLALLLLDLEFKGFLDSLPGKRYCRKN
jgi:DNA processing protein